MKWRQFAVLVALLVAGVGSGTTSSESVEAAAGGRASRTVSAIVNDRDLWVGSTKDLDALSNHGARDVKVLPEFRYATDHLGYSIHADKLRVGGLTGRGVAVGVLDSGIDVTHPDFRFANGKSRVRWYIDYGLPVSGKHLELEQAFGIPNEGAPCEVRTVPVCFGQVLSNEDIDEILQNPLAVKPTDVVGHGSHVTGIAAGGGSTGRYVGVAPEADLLIVKARRPGQDGGGPLAVHILNGTQFLFNRADALGIPVVVNLSLATVLPAPDGTDPFERAFTKIMGGPGHIVVAAAGNDGNVYSGISQTVAMSSGAAVRVPVDLGGDGKALGKVIVIVTGEPGKSFSVGIDTDVGRWISSRNAGRSDAEISGVTGFVAWGDRAPQGLLPPGSNAAVVGFTGSMANRTVFIRVQGEGTVSMRLAASPATAGIFTTGTREGTIALPARAPSVISVGCTVNREMYRSQAGTLREMPPRRNLDPAGGVVVDGLTKVREGDVCSFTSSGPGSGGAMKPELLAPGAGIVSAQSNAATPDNVYSIFNKEKCTGLVRDDACLIIEQGYGIASGTSMSSPVVAGVAALLLQRNPKLTQEQMRAALMAGVHYWRRGPSFNEQSGAGEIDAVLALEAVDRMATFRAVTPVAERSWLALSSDYVRASGSEPVEAVLELRGSQGELADFDDPTALSAQVSVDGELVGTPPIIARRGPGIWTYQFAVPPGKGTGSVTFGATYKGAPIVAAKRIPIATDWWSARYPTTASSACALQPRRDESSAWRALVGMGVLGALLARRRRYT